MKAIKTVLVLCALVMVASNAFAGVRTVKGLWVTTADDRSYWLRLQTATDSAAGLVEDLSGSITSSSVGGSDTTTQEAPVTGQYLVRTGIVVLNIGKPGVNRLYAVGDTRGEGRHMNMRLFKVRPGQDLNFERELWLDPKSEPHQP